MWRGGLGGCCCVGCCELAREWKDMYTIWTRLERNCMVGARMIRYDVLLLG